MEPPTQQFVCSAINMKNGQSISNQHQCQVGVGQGLSHRLLTEEPPLALRKNDRSITKLRQNMQVNCNLLSMSPLIERIKLKLANATQ